MDGLNEFFILRWLFRYFFNATKLHTYVHAVLADREMERMRVFSGWGARGETLLFLPNGLSDVKPFEVDWIEGLAETAFRLGLPTSFGGAAEGSAES